MNGLMSPDDYKRQLDKDAAERKEIREENVREREKDRAEAASTRKGTLTLGILSGLIGLVAGFGNQLISALDHKPAPTTVYALEMSSTPFGGKNIMGLFRFDAKSGTTWYAAPKTDSTFRWVLIDGPPNAAPRSQDTIRNRQ